MFKFPPCLWCLVANRQTRTAVSDVTIVTHLGHLYELSFFYFLRINRFFVPWNDHNDVMSEPANLRLNGIEVPLDRRLNADHPHFAAIMSLHRDAISRRRPSYRDPVSGYSVFTAKFLADRAYCCASGCRHCPFEQLR